jgi:hypothetical protein
METCYDTKKKKREEDLLLRRSLTTPTKFLFQEAPETPFGD